MSGDEGLNTIIHTPAVKHDALIDGVAVPVLQMMVTAILSGLVVAVLAALAGAAWWYKAGAAVAVVVALVSWLNYRDGWQHRLEVLLNVDLDQDGSIGDLPPVPPPLPPLRVEVIEDGGRAASFIDLPYPDKLPALARSVLAGREFSQVAYVGTGKLFTRSEYDELVTALIKAGLCRWRNDEHHNAGILLSGSGRAVFRRLADHPPTLPPAVRE